jgi:hypothetical protein
MNGRERQWDSGDYPRYARLPASGGRPQADVRDPQRRPQHRSQRVPNRNENRSRVLAVVILVVAAVIIIMTGLAISSRSSGSGETIPFNVLPFPGNTVTTSP